MSTIVDRYVAASATVCRKTRQDVKELRATITDIMESGTLTWEPMRLRPGGPSLAIR